MTREGEDPMLKAMGWWTREAAIRWPLELGLLGGAALIWGGGEYVRLRRAPASATERTVRDLLNALDARARRLLLRPGRTVVADRASDALAYAAVPLASGLVLWLVEPRPKRLVRDLLRVARIVTATGALNQAIKFVAPRERPFARELPEGGGRDRNGSFFSNHTSSMAALAAASTRLALERGASAVYGVPLFALASFVGYLRIAADRHWLTDVVAGAAFGTALGVLLTR